ncbi:hypothetical protein B0H14DRAFT_2763218 [Mycena olivaceomarginata]|nr:hypothetical protein B0H14DRAFT_2763218 [Mycena olivaceomarginata]
MEMGQDNSSSGIWEPVSKSRPKGGYLEGVGRGNGLHSGSRCSLANVDEDQGGGVGNGIMCARLKTGRWWGHAHAQPGGGGGSVRQAPVEAPSPLILRLRPNCASPHARCVAPFRNAHIGHDVCICRSAVALGCPATHLRARLSSPSLYSPFSERPCATGFAAWGVGVGERGEGRGGRWEGCCPLRARQPSTATAQDYRCGCIVHRRDCREAPSGARDGLRSAASSMVRRTYIETGGNVGGQGSVLLLRIQLRGAWGSFGLECTAAGGGSGRITRMGQYHLGEA